MKRLFYKVGLPNGGVLRLFIAIVISVLLHFFWLTEFSWELPKQTTDKHLIDARLEPIKPNHIKPTLIKPKEALKEIVKQHEQKQAKSAKPMESEALALLPAYIPPALPTPEEAVVEAMMDTESDLSSIFTDANGLIETTTDTSSIVAVASPKAEPYQYIDTTFDIYLNEDNTRSGVAKIVYDATSEIGRYKLHWSIEAAGLLAVFYPDLVQTSEGLIDVEQGLRPANYHYQFGNKANKSYQAAFDWAKGELLLQSSKGDKTVALTENVQDYLSFMYQFMFKPPLNAMQIGLTNGKQLASYDYTFEGEETLKLDFGEVKTYHIKHAKSDSDEKTELWLAIDYQFIPVKISKTEKDGQVINQIAKVIYTKPVQLIQELPLP